MEFNSKLKRWRTAHLGGHDMVGRVDPNGEAPVVQQALGLCSPSGAELGEPL